MLPPTDPYPAHSDSVPPSVTTSARAGEVIHGRPVVGVVPELAASLVAFDAPAESAHHRHDVHHGYLGRVLSHSILLGH